MSRYQRMIDRALYVALPKVAHQWGAENRAKVRARAMALLASVLVFGVRRYVPADLQTEVLTVGVPAVIAYVGNLIHKVVTPWEEEL